MNSNYTQGVGLFYRVEFNSFEELYKRYINRLRRKDRETEPETESESESETEWDSETKKATQDSGKL